MTLPPGQRRIDGFPRFGTHLHDPPPPVPERPEIEVTGAVEAPFAVPLADLDDLPRREQTADFHCVAGWSATGLRWEGVPFRAFWERVVAPAIPAGTTVTHVAFRGLDGYRSVLTLEDALGEDVLIAQHLDGRPLDGDHGAPARLLSPGQYGFMSTKHLCRIEVHDGDPGDRLHPSWWRRLGLELVKPHRRARVWEEERHRYLPARVVRPLYHGLIPVIRRASARGADRRG
jgi:DMSO/TMAO reductase YedYZ molybdopterin-dependent catalytic subunit